MSASPAPKTEYVSLQDAAVIYGVSVKMPIAVTRYLTCWLSIGTTGAMPCRAGRGRL